MEISANALATREIAINKSQIGQDILAKTLQKAEETKQAQNAQKPQQVQQSPASTQRGHLNIYA